ncbi:hypothetical protein QUA27_26615 [Microcoleus sp. Pol14C6]
MNANNGIITQQGRYSVSKIIDRTETILQAKGITIWSKASQSLHL